MHRLAHTKVENGLNIGPEMLDSLGGVPVELARLWASRRTGPVPIQFDSTPIK